MNDIFVQIASYRDPELKPTLKDLLEKATNPQNLKICIAHQHSKDDEWDTLDEYKDDDRFIILDIDYKESEGACWARNKIQQHYNGEKYTLQLDSHHRFVEGWDDECIQMLEKLQEKGYNKPLLTSYIPSYQPDNDPKGRVNTPWGMSFDRFTPEGVIFFLPYYIESKETEPIPARFYSAHFAFTLGIFAEEVQHDPQFYFHGEEITIAVRAFTHGYDLFHPNKVIAWHEYTREGRTKQWDDDPIWGERNTKTHQKVRQLLGVDGTPCTPCNKKSFGKYGLGEKRTLQDWEKYAGIRFEDRAIQESTSKNLPPMERDEPYLPKVKEIIQFNRNKLLYEDYTFWALIFEDEQGNSLFREDLQEQEIKKYLKMDRIGIWKQYNGRKPYKWIVWPHSKEHGWCDKIEHIL